MGGGDCQGRACHEPSDSRRGDELDEPAQTKQTKTEDDEATDEGERDSDLDIIPAIAVVLLNGGDNVGNLERHHSDWTNRYILGCGKELDGMSETATDRDWDDTYGVHEDANEGGIETILDRQCGNLIGYQRLSIQGQWWYTFA